MDSVIRPLSNWDQENNMRSQGTQVTLKKKARFLEYMGIFP